MTALPGTPPFALRARLLSPLADGGLLHELDGLVEVDEAGRITRASAWHAGAEAPASVHDVRPLVVMPGLVDLHAHLPQLPNAGLGSGLDLLTWLDRYIFPLERAYDRSVAERQAPAAFRAVIGKVMMDRLSYDADIAPGDILETSLRQTDDLAARWHGRDDGRLRYAVTPRFAVSCSAAMLRESAALAARHGAYWQTHLAEDPGEIAEVARLFPEARDYLDVYDRAGALGARTVLAHAIHLSEREVARLVEADARVAHCPASNLFLSSGLMPLAPYRAAGMTVGLGSDVAAGPEVSIFTVMRAAAVTQRVLELTGRADAGAANRPLDWIRLGSLEGARALGLDAEIGSLEAGKEADLIAIDPRFTNPLPSDVPPEGADDLASRLVFRPHPNMVRGAWVRGRLLAGPPGTLGIG